MKKYDILVNGKGFIEATEEEMKVLQKFTRIKTKTRYIDCKDDIDRADLITIKHISNDRDEVLRLIELLKAKDIFMELKVENPKAIEDYEYRINKIKEKQGYVTENFKTRLRNAVQTKYNCDLSKKLSINDSESVKIELARNGFQWTICGSIDGEKLNDIKELIKTESLNIHYAKYSSDFYIIK